MDIKIRIPAELEEYAPHLEGLLLLMVSKLFVNAHKATPERREVEVFIRRMREELEELEEQLAENRMKGNALFELADVGNFVLLSYIALRNEQMENKGRIDEKSRIRVSQPALPRVEHRDASSGALFVQRFPVGNHPNDPAPERDDAFVLRRGNGPSHSDDDTVGRACD